MTAENNYPPLEGGSQSSIAGWGKHKFLKETQKNAKYLRNNATLQEKILWKYLRKRGLLNIKFRRQQPIGCYIVDFISIEKNLIIELDGGQHNTNKSMEYDKKRDEFLQSKGYKIIRIWNNHVTNNIDGVIEYLKSEINNPTPKSEISTLPQGEGMLKGELNYENTSRMSGKN